MINDTSNNGTYFEILVYTCDQDIFLDHVTKKAKKEMASVPDYGNGFWQEQLNDSIKRKFKPIRYNELIGYVVVYPLYWQLRADYWFTDKKRIVIGSKEKGVITHRRNILEKNYKSSSLTSPEIFCEFRGELDDEVRKHWELKNGFVDFSALDRIGPHVDWRSVLKLRNTSMPIKCAAI